MATHNSLSHYYFTIHFMKKLFFPLLFLTTLAQAQQPFNILTFPGDTAKITSSDSLRMQRSTPMEGVANFSLYEIFDSTGNAVVSYVAQEKDTISVQWGLNQMACRSCAGYKIFVRMFLLHGPGLNAITPSLPGRNTDPAYDETWDTSLGILSIALDENKQPRMIVLRRPNGYSIKFNQRKQ